MLRFQAYEKSRGSSEGNDAGLIIWSCAWIVTLATVEVESIERLGFATVGAEDVVGT